MDGTLHVVEFEIELSYDVSLLEGHVRPYTAAPCAPAFLQGGAHERYVVVARVCAGSLESSEPF